MSQQQLNPKRFDYPVTTSEVAPKAALSEEDIGRPVTKEDAADVQSLEAQIIGKVSKNRSRSQFTPHLLVLLSIVISLTTPVHHTSGWLQVTTSGLFGLKTLAETSSKVTSLSGEHTLHTLSVPKKTNSTIFLTVWCIGPSCHLPSISDLQGWLYLLPAISSLQERGSHRFQLAASIMSFVHHFTLFPNSPDLQGWLSLSPAISR